MEGKTVKKRTGREYFEYRYRWYNGVELREEEPTLVVNLFCLEIWNQEKGKATCRNKCKTAAGRL
jgi:hypothetical protein